MTTAAQRYGVSFVYLKRACDALDIPHPGRGHLAKVTNRRFHRFPPTSRLVLRAYPPDRRVAWQQDGWEKKLGDLPTRFRTVRRERQSAGVMTDSSAVGGTRSRCSKKFR